MAKTICNQEKVLYIFAFYILSLCHIRSMPIKYFATVKIYVFDNSRIYGLYPPAFLQSLCVRNFSLKK